MKENNEVTLTKIIEQLSCSISTRIQNIEKEMKQKKFILVLLGKKEHEESAKFMKTAEENLSKLSESLDKMKEHSQLSLEILEEAKVLTVVRQPKIEKKVENKINKAQPKLGEE